MAIIKLKKDKNAQHFELKSVQDVKVNGRSVFDGEEANIRLVEVPSLPLDTTKIYVLKYVNGTLVWVEEN